MPNIALIVNNILSDSGVDLSGKADLVNGLVPASQLPSYVDDVLTYANLASFPATGETGKIYVANDTNKTYRWSGSAYIEISASPGSTDAVPEGTTNLYFTTARARAAISVSGSLSYNSSTGVISYTQPSNVSTFTNDANYITLTQARAGLSLTTTGSSGAATYNSSTGAFNIPQYTLSGLGGEPAITAGTTAQYWRGDKTWQTLNTAAVAESAGSLYYTDARARAALSFTAGSGAYNSSTGVITIPTNTNQLTNGAGFITGYTETDTLQSVILRNATTNTGFVIENGNSTYSTPASTNVPRIYIHNTSSSTDGHAILSLRTLGPTGGNPFLSLDINGVLGWSVGIDNSDGDKFKISKSWASISTNTYFTIDTSGNTTLSGSATASSFVKSGGTSAQFLMADGSVSTNPGWITGYTEADTLATVTARGASTSTNLSFTGTLSFGSATRQMINLWSTIYGIGIQSGTLYFRSDGRFSWHVGGSHNDAENNPGGGTTVMTLTTSGLSVGGHTVLHANNYGSYALPLSGGTMSGQILGPSTGSDVYGGLVHVRERGYVLQTQSDWSYSPAITFHWGNRAAIRFGLRADGLMAVDDAPIALRSWVTSQGYVTGGPYLPLSGGTMTGSIVNNTDGAVIVESNTSENNNWLWKEAVKQWGLFWFNKGSQAGQTIGTYTTLGAEVFYMGGSSGIDMPTNWTGYQSGSKIAAMISNFNGYIYSASTVYAATSMLVGGNTVLHAGNYNSYSPTLTGGGASGTWGINITGNAVTVGSRSVGNGKGNIAYFDSNGNLFINNPETYSGEVRLGAAWGYGGVYAAGNLTLSTSGSQINFVFNNSLPASINSSGSITSGGTINFTGKGHYLGASSGWDGVGFGNLTNLHFQGHPHFWIGAGNAYWYRGGIATEHDLLITTMYGYGSTSYYRGITFAVENNGDGSNGGYRLGRWQTYNTSWTTARLQVDASLCVGYGPRAGFYADTASWPKDYGVWGHGRNESGYLDERRRNLLFSPTANGGGPWGSFASLEVSSILDGNNDVPALFRIHQWGSGAAEFWKPQGTVLYLRESPSGGSIYHGSWFTRFQVQREIYSEADIVAYASDKRLKENYQPLENAVEKIKTLTGLTFDWKDNVKDLGFDPMRKHEVGVLAQDVEAVLPEAVRLAPFDDDGKGNSKSGENYLTVKYEKLVPLLIQGIKEQQQQIEAQKTEIEELKDLVKQLLNK